METKQIVENLSLGFIRYNAFYATDISAALEDLIMPGNV
jgi:hypothetical protein